MKVNKLLVLVLGLVFILAACGSNNETEANEGEG